MLKIPQKIFSSRKIQRYCRMCENKLLFETKDGLCIGCHMSLCRDNNCERCWNMADKLLKWIAKEKGYNEQEESQEE